MSGNTGGSLLLNCLLGSGIILIVYFMLNPKTMIPGSEIIHKEFKEKILHIASAAVPESIKNTEINYLLENLFTNKEAQVIVYGEGGTQFAVTSIEEYLEEKIRYAADLKDIKVKSVLTTSEGKYAEIKVVEVYRQIEESEE